MQAEEKSIQPALQIAVKNLCSVKLIFFSDEKAALMGVFKKLMEQASPQRGLGILSEDLLGLIKCFEEKRLSKEFFSQEEISALCNTTCPAGFTFRYYVLGSRISVSEFPKTRVALQKQFGNALIDAAKAYDVVTMLRLLQEGADVNLVDADGNSALHHAAARGYFEAVRFLVKFGAVIDCKNNNRRRPLDFALEMRCASVMEFLIDSRANTENLDVSNLQQEHEKPLLRLLGRAVPLNIVGPEDATVLKCIEKLEACSFWNGTEKKQFVESIISFVKSNQVSYAKTLEMCFPVLEKYFTPEVLKDILQTKISGDYALLYYIVRELDIPSMCEKLASVVEQIEMSFLHLNDTKAVSTAVCAGVNLEWCCDNKTRLHHAVLAGNHAVAADLIRRCPVLLNRRDRKENTALHYAAMQGAEALVFLLVNKGANRLMRARDLASSHGHELIVTSLERCIDHSPALHKPVFLGTALALGAPDSPRNAYRLSPKTLKLLEENEPGLLQAHHALSEMNRMLGDVRSVPVDDIRAYVVKK